MDPKLAYRNFVSLGDPDFPEVPLAKWNQLAKLIELKVLHSQRLEGKKTSVQAEIDKETKDWTYSDRQRFKVWFDHTRPRVANTRVSMEKQALYHPHGSNESDATFLSVRKSLTRRLRKLQNEIAELYQNSSRNVQWSDTPGAGPYKSGAEKLNAILNALNQVCTLLTTLRTKEVTAACLIRTGKILTSLDKNIGDRYKEVVGSKAAIVRIARNAEVSAVIADLKKEMEALHYATHLRRIYNIYDRLNKLGLSSQSADVEKIIQKDLTDVSSLSKKLSEVYVSLIEMPSQTEEDKPAVTPAPVASTPAPMQSDFKQVEAPKPQNVPAKQVRV